MQTALKSCLTASWHKFNIWDQSLLTKLNKIDKMCYVFWSWDWPIWSDVAFCFNNVWSKYDDNESLSVEKNDADGDETVDVY